MALQLGYSGEWRSLSVCNQLDNVLHSALFAPRLPPAQLFPCLAVANTVRFVGFDTVVC